MVGLLCNKSPFRLGFEVTVKIHNYTSYGDTGQCFPRKVSESAFLIMDNPPQIRRCKGKVPVYGRGL